MTGNTRLIDLGEKAVKQWDEEGERYKSYNCCFSFLLDNGSIVQAEGHSCHGSLMDANYGYGLAAGVEGILTRIQTRATGYVDPERGTGGLLPPKELTAFYDYLLNKSVFRDCYVTKDPESVVTKGVVVRTDIPANLTAAASIAIRSGWEIPCRATSLLNMLDMGVEHNEAYIASFMLHVNPDGTFTTHKYNDHCAIYAYYLTPNGVKNIKNAVVGVGCPEETYREELSYCGVPYMWNNPYDRENMLSTPRGRTQERSNPFGVIHKVAKAEVPDAISAVDYIFKNCERGTL